MRGIWGIVLAFAGIAIFTFALINLGAQMSIDNSANQSILDNREYGDLRSSLNTSLRDYKTDANDSITSFLSTIPIVGESIQLVSVSGIWKTLITLPKAAYEATIGTASSELFGSGNATVSTLLTIASALFIGYVIFFSWKWIRSGDPT